MVDYFENDENNEIEYKESCDQKCEDENFYDIVSEMVEDINSYNCEPLSKKVKLSQNEYDQIERECLHKKYGCYQCRSNYNGEVDLEYHQKLDILFNQMKQSIKLTNKTV